MQILKLSRREHAQSKPSLRARAARRSAHIRTYQDHVPRCVVACKSRACTHMFCFHVHHVHAYVHACTCPQAYVCTHLCKFYCNHTLAQTWLFLLLCMKVSMRTCAYTHVNLLCVHTYQSLHVRVRACLLKRNTHKKKYTHVHTYARARAYVATKARA